MHGELGYGRTLMGDSLGFHILFALLGVGIPLLVSVAEALSIIKKDPDYLTMAKRWSFVMSVLFVIGAISGTIIAFQMNILWPKFMELAGKVIGMPFALEGNAFMIEAVFLGIYLFTWDRFRNPWIHWLCSLPIILGGAASAFFITTANAFMNNPAGFDMVNGVPVNIRPWEAVFNPATPTETSHSIMAYYLTTCLAFAGVVAINYWRNKDEKIKQYYQKALVLLVGMGLIFALLVGLTGDRSAKYLAKEEPIKFAAAEALFESKVAAPLQLGGVVKDRELVGAIKLPGLLSLLAYNNINAEVKGLLAFDPNLWPPLYVHYMFDGMVAIGGLLVAVPVLFLGLYWKKRTVAFSRPLLLLLMLSGVAGFLAVEFGWVLTEVGRQPYIIRDIMLTKDAFTTAEHVMTFGYIFPSLYLVLFIITPWVILRYFRRHPLKLSMSKG